MPRRTFAPTLLECDPQSSLMSDLAVMSYLGTGGKGIDALIKQKRLKRDPLTGSFAREQVIRVHDEIHRGIVEEDAASGPGAQYRQEPQLG